MTIAVAHVRASNDLAILGCGGAGSCSQGRQALETRKRRQLAPEGRHRMGGTLAAAPPELSRYTTRSPGAITPGYTTLPLRGNPLDYPVSLHNI
jgi:hypothetical protein